jgi:hypothetical protein
MLLKEYDVDMLNLIIYIYMCTVKHLRHQMCRVIQLLYEGKINIFAHSIPIFKCGEGERAYVSLVLNGIIVEYTFC